MPSYRTSSYSAKKPSFSYTGRPAGVASRRTVRTRRSSRYSRACRSNRVPMPRPRVFTSTRTIAIQATLPRTQVVVVPTAYPSNSATKQPSGSKCMKRSQSASVWFHRACRDNLRPSSRSSIFITLMWIAFMNPSQFSIRRTGLFSASRTSDTSMGKSYGPYGVRIRRSGSRVAYCTPLDHRHSSVMPQRCIYAVSAQPSFYPSYSR